jgi:hypothetical protein
MTETHSLNQTMHLHSPRHSGDALQELTACLGSYWLPASLFMGISRK